MKKMYIVINSEELPKKPIVQSAQNPAATTVNIEKPKVEPSTSDLLAMMKGFQDQNALLTKLLLEKGQTAPAPAFDMKDFARIIDGAIRSNQDSKTGRTFGISPVNMEDVDPDDVLEVAAYFFSYSYKYAVYDDVRNGIAVNPPYGAVKFNPLFRSSPTGKVYGTSARYSNISYALVYSKKQAEWLKKHSLFGVMFFENIGAAKSVNYLEAETIAKAYQSVQGLTGFKLRQRCVAEGIDISTIDDTIMRQQLIDKISKRLQAENKAIQESNLRSSLTKEVETINFGSSASMSSK